MSESIIKCPNCDSVGVTIKYPIDFQTSSQITKKVVCKCSTCSTEFKVNMFTPYGEDQKSKGRIY